MKPEPIRILHVLNSLNRGGAESMLINYYRAMNRSMVQFDFVVHQDPPGIYAAEIQKLGGHIYYVPKFHGYNFVQCIIAWEKIFRVTPNDSIVQGHMPSTAGLYLGLARLYGRIAIAHAHSSDKYNEDSYLQHIARWGLYGLTRHVAQYFFACSKEAGMVRYGEEIVTSKRFAIWHNAIDYKRFSYQPLKRKELREGLGISRNTMVIGHVGRLTWAKNHDFLLQVFAGFHKKHSNSVLLLVGDGERREELEQLVKRVGLDQAVIFTGGVSNVEDYMNAMDLFLFPSHYEGLPTATIEAQVNGLSCVISDVISKDVDVSFKGQVCFISLNQPFAWIGATEKALLNTTRQAGVVQSRDYDIQEAVRWAENEYKKILIGGRMHC